MVCKENNKIIDNKESIKDIDNREKINNIDNKENAKIIIGNKEDINNSLLMEKNEEYKNRIKELENQLIEKDKLLKEEKIKNDNLNENL